MSKERVEKRKIQVLEEGEIPEYVTRPGTNTHAPKTEQKKKKRPMVVTMPTAAQREILERARRGDFELHTAHRCHCITLGTDGGEDKLCQKNTRKGGGDVYCAEHDAKYQHELSLLAQKRAARMLQHSGNVDKNQDQDFCGVDLLLADFP